MFKLNSWEEIGIIPTFYVMEYRIQCLKLSIYFPVDFYLNQHTPLGNGRTRGF